MENIFSKFNLNKMLIDKLTERRITSPTDIQGRVIPGILKGDDCIVQEKTGTGKTLAYLLPILHNLLIKRKPALIIIPTKELGIQVYNEILYYTRDTKIKSVLLIGGEDMEKQEKKVKENYDIIVGVTGRITKLIDSGDLKLSGIKTVILDEADFLIELGFYKDLERIFSYIKNIEQFLVFSATLSGKTKDSITSLIDGKKSVNIQTKMTIPENIENYFIPLENNERDVILLKLLGSINPYLCVIFVRTKKESVWLYNILKKENYEIACLNGDLNPSQRKKAIDDFKKTKIQYLVSTDLASRGLDVEGINFVINYNQPLNETDYLHRAGRTGRLDNKGIVYNLCNELDEGYLKKYAFDLKFDLIPVKITKDGIVQYKNYHGVKPRFNIEEKKKIEKLKIINKKIKEKKENGNKKRRRSNKR